MASVPLQRITAVGLLGDGIDPGFIVTIALFRGPGLGQLLAKVDLNGPIADNSTIKRDLEFQVPAIYDTDINGSTMYVDHKNGSGSGKWQRQHHWQYHLGVFQQRVSAKRQPMVSYLRYAVRYREQSR